MDELITDFLTETKEGLELLDTQLVTLEQDPSNKELLSSIFRIMHTIKGTCGFLGLPRLEAVAHAGENIMDKLRNNEIEASVHNVAMIIQAIDKIKGLVTYLEATGKEAEGNDQQLITKLNQAAAGESKNVTQSKDALEIPEKVNSSVANNEITKHAPEDQVNKTNQQPYLSDEAKKEAVTKGLEVAKKENDEVEKSQVTASHSIRVNVNILENLMQIVSELVLNRNQLIQLDRSVKDNKFTNSIQRLSHITSALQDGIMKTRMQPIKNAWTKFPRLVRDLSIELGKKIELVMIGEDTELDRQLIETIKDPLTHMVRNSADHGLEKSEERIQNGKPEVGTITLKAYHQGGHIIIEISDDGRGINIIKIKEKILEKNLASKADADLLTDQQLMQYIFKAGFSTAERITSVSGRGVGMDVVKTNIEKISGTVELNSEMGQGSRFIIKIPLTLAIMPILIVESGGEKFGIPQINIIEMVRAGSSSEYHVEEINGKKILRLRSQLLSLISLAEILQLNDKPQDNVVKGKKNAKSEMVFIVVCEVNGRNFGVIVDKIYDTEEIVVKPVSPILKRIGMYSGNTILGDGQVIMILDPAGIIEFLSEEIDLIREDNLLTNHPDNLAKRELLSSFLILESGNNVNRALPLELVARLEEINVKNIELSAGKKVVQYRDSLMFLTELNPEFKYPKKGSIEVVVFNNKEKTLGLVVEKIIDIVEQNMESNKVLEDTDFSALVINGKTMDIINISEFFDKTFNLDEEEVVTSKISSSSKNILFIDDSPFFRKFIPPTIIDAGYKVSTVENAEKALNMLNIGTKFDLIITDINMPSMSGVEFVENCKKDERFKDIPIIALTSNNEELKKNRNALNKDIIACVSKTNHDDLIEVLSNILNG